MAKVKTIVGEFKKETTTFKKVWNQLLVKVDWKTDVILECEEAPFVENMTVAELEHGISYLRFFDIYVRYNSAYVTYAQSLLPEIKAQMKIKMDKAISDFYKEIKKNLK